MSLQETLNAMRVRSESGQSRITPEQHAVMSRATAELIATGQAERALKAGDVAPDFTLNDPEGKPVTSRDFLARGPLVISFYRGVWCPYCNAELKALQEALPEIVARGANLIAISPQTAPNSRRSQRDNNLTFPILSDPKAEVAHAFGVRFKLPDELVAVYKDLKNDLALINNDPSWVLPMPARYVISTNGAIAYAEVNPDYKYRPEPSELFPVLDRLRAD